MVVIMCHYLHLYRFIPNPLIFILPKTYLLFVIIAEVILKSPVLYFKTCLIMSFYYKYQSDHLSGNVGEFDSCQGNVGDFTK